MRYPYLKNAEMKLEESSGINTWHLIWKKGVNGISAY